MIARASGNCAAERAPRPASYSPCPAPWWEAKTALRRPPAMTVDATCPNGPLEVPMPFKSLGLHPLLVQATREVRYVDPTPIQAEAIPAILAGRDLIATAQTGTGKTAAFLLPILHQLLGLPLGTTQALVLAPTRELAQQIDEVCLGLAYHIPIRIGLLVGGAAMGAQEKA